MILPSFLAGIRYNLSKTITEFSKLLLPFLDSVLHNQLTINWNKTKIMIITKQHIVRPKSSVINSITDEVVDEVVDVFKLLGVTIDHNLLFYKYLNVKGFLLIESCTLLKSFFPSINIKVPIQKPLFSLILINVAHWR